MTQTGRIRTNGAEIAFVLRGEGPPTLWIQGVGAAGCVWGPQLEYFSRSRTCVAYDNRGIGASSLTGPLRFEDMVDDAVALLDHLGWERADIVGHSMGGVIAHQLALDHPDRVRSLALLCTFARGSDVPRASGRLIWLGLRSMLGTRRMRRNAFLEMIVSPDVLAGADRDELGERLNAVFGRDLADNPAFSRVQLRACAKHDASARLPELAGLEVLVASGRHDIVAAPERGQELAAAIGTELVLWDAGHAAPVTHVDLVNRDLEAFLK